MGDITPPEWVISGTPVPYRRQQTSVLPAGDRVTYTPTGLIFAEGTTFEDWIAVGRALRAITAAIQWLVGDWLHYGEARFGEQFAQYADLIGVRKKTLQNWAWVSGRVPLSRRRENLSWAHHAEVAALPPDEQERWLAAAEMHGWTRRQLRAAITGEDETVDEDGMIVCPMCRGQGKIPADDD